MPAFGITDAELQAQIAELQALPEDELNALFAEESSDVQDGHLVEYVEECVKHTERTEDERMKLDEQLWYAHEGKQMEMAQKEDWQAKITTNEPFQTVIQAKMLVRKAVTDKPEWFTVDSEQKDNPTVMAKVSLWNDSLRWWAKRAKITQVLPDMTEMAFALGISLASKAVWSVDANGQEGLRIVKIEPWKLRRDTDAMSRDSQSGLYCIHQDWVDYHVLLEGEKNGQYINVKDCLKERGDEGTWDRRNERKRRGLVDYTHRFRPQIFVREFWGAVLDHHGELIYPNVRFTVANRTVITRPIPTKFPKIRWPIHQFSALPHMRNFHGYSLVEGMLKMWKFRNNLLSMTADKMSFVLNSAYEVDESKLVNPADKELYPGCTKSKKMNAQGSAYTEIRMSGDFLPQVESLMGMTGNLFQNGVFVTELLKGEMGSRKDITKGEVEIKTEQALGVFEGIGKDVEYGGEQFIEMIQDVLTTYWDPWDSPGYLQVLGRKHEQILGHISMLSPDQRIEAMRQETDISINGVSIIFKKSALVDRLINLVKLTDSPRFQPYAKDDVMIRKLSDAMDVSEAIKSEEEMLQEQMQQQALMAAQAQAMGSAVDGGKAPASGEQMADQALAAAGISSGGGA